MLSELRIVNYALIDQLELELHPGLNVLTGETGAGKSILLGALSLVLGERPDPGTIRTGETRAQVEARFDCVKTGQAACEDSGVEVLDGQLLLRRRIEQSGRNAAYANDATMTVNALKRIGDRLIDLHGQHQHQLLLRPEVHREILDAYAGIADSRLSFDEAYARYVEGQAELARLRIELQARREKRDLTEYQARELTDAGIRAGEIEELQGERELLESAERRYTLARELEELLSESEGSVTERLAGAARRLQELSGLDPGLDASRQVLADVEAQTDDLWRQLVRYREGIQFSPERLEEVNSRLFLIEKLERKHGVSAEELPELTERLGRELESIEVDETRCTELTVRLKQKEQSLLEQAAGLSRARQRTKRKLETKLKTEFAPLGLDKADFVVDLACPGSPAPADLAPGGYDAVEFMFSANPGEERRPLRKTASGGELSRVMLGLKTVLSRVNVVPTMVFDEIDVGIGGRIAEAVGRKLAALGRHQQVICITHLPQIAKYADRHFLVTKSTSGGRTRTAVRQLDVDDRVDELARMVAGSKVTETSLAHAREMLGKATRDR